MALWPPRGSRDVEAFDHAKGHGARVRHSRWRPAGSERSVGAQQVPPREEESTRQNLPCAQSRTRRLFGWWAAQDLNLRTLACEIRNGSQRPVTRRHGTACRATLTESAAPSRTHAFSPIGRSWLNSAGCLQRLQTPARDVTYKPASASARKRRPCSTASPAARASLAFAPTPEPTRSRGLEPAQGDFDVPDRRNGWGSHMLRSSNQVKRGLPGGWP